jgi:hypothetical protein
MLRRHRSDRDPRAEAITPEDFRLEQTNLDEALDVCAICRQPSG